MNIYKRHRFPPDIISYAVWLYYRFNLSHRDIEDLLAERSITVSYETIRLWCIKFGAKYARRLKRRHLVRAQHYRKLRVSAFNEWSRAVA
jgi:putative transposase